MCNSLGDDCGRESAGLVVMVVSTQRHHRRCPLWLCLRLAVYSLWDLEGTFVLICTVVESLLGIELTLIGVGQIFSKLFGRRIDSGVANVGQMLLGKRWGVQVEAKIGQTGCFADVISNRFGKANRGRCVRLDARVRLFGPDDAGICHRFSKRGLCSSTGDR